MLALAHKKFEEQEGCEVWENELDKEDSMCYTPCTGALSFEDDAHEL